MPFDPRTLRNSARWKKHVAYVKARWPMCCDPFRVHEYRRRLEVADDIHHVERLAERPDLATTLSNTAPVCKACHGRLNGEERKGRGTRHLFERWRETVSERGMW